MLVRELMNIYPIHVYANVTTGRAAEVISLSGMSDLMVVDDQNHFVGVLSEDELIQPLLPDLEEVIELGGSLEDALNFFEEKGGEFSNYPIAPLVNKEPIVLNPYDEAFCGTTILIQKQFRCLPVVDNGYLVGSFCKADICRGIIRTYHNPMFGRHSPTPERTATCSLFKDSQAIQPLGGDTGGASQWQ